MKVKRRELQVVAFFFQGVFFFVLIDFTFNVLNKKAIIARSLQYFIANKLNG